MPGTFSEEYPEEYAYFRDLLAVGLLLGSADSDEESVLRRAVRDLANRRVVSHCECGAAGCKTFRFEHSGAKRDAPMSVPGAGLNVILFRNCDDEMTELEQYPLGD